MQRMFTDGVFVKTTFSDLTEQLWWGLVSWARFRCGSFTVMYTSCQLRKDCTYRLWLQPYMVIMRGGGKSSMRVLLIFPPSPNPQGWEGNVQPIPCQMGIRNYNARCLLLQSRRKTGSDAQFFTLRWKWKITSLQGKHILPPWIELDPYFGLLLKFTLHLTPLNRQLTTQLRLIRDTYVWNSVIPPYLPSPLATGWRLIFIRKSHRAVNRLTSRINVALTHLCPLSSALNIILQPFWFLQPFVSEAFSNSLVSTNHVSAFRPHPLFFPFIHSHFTASTSTHRTRVFPHYDLCFNLPSSSLPFLKGFRFYLFSFPPPSLSSYWPFSLSFLQCQSHCSPYFSPLYIPHSLSFCKVL